MSSATSESQLSNAGLAADASGITPPSTPTRQGVFLSDVIVDLGFADHEAVEEVVRAAAASGRPFDRLLLENGVLDGEQLSRAVAERNGLDQVDLDRFDLDPVAATLIGRSAAMRYSALPIAIAPDGALVVAVADPSDFLGVSDIEVMTKTEVRLAIASPDKILALIEGLPDDPPQAAIAHAPAESPGPSGDVVEIGVPPADRGGEGRDEAGSTEIEQLRQELLDTTEKRERLREEADRLNEELQAAASEKERLREEVHGLREETDRLREELSAATSEKEQLREEVEIATREREPPPTDARHSETSGEYAAGTQPSRAEAEISDDLVLGEVTLDEEEGTATVPVRVNSAGRLIVSGKGVQSSSVIVSAADRTSLEVIPIKNKKRKLNETGRVKVEVNVTFVPAAAGEPCTQVTEVRLVKRGQGPQPRMQ